MKGIVHMKEKMGGRVAREKRLKENCARKRMDERERFT